MRGSRASITACNTFHFTLKSLRLKLYRTMLRLNIGEVSWVQTLV